MYIWRTRDSRARIRSWDCVSLTFCSYIAVQSIIICNACRNPGIRCNPRILPYSRPGCGSFHRFESEDRQSNGRAYRRQYSRLLLQCHQWSVIQRLAWSDCARLPVRCIWQPVPALYWSSFQGRSGAGPVDVTSQEFLSGAGPADVTFQDFWPLFLDHQVDFTQGQTRFGHHIDIAQRWWVRAWKCDRWNGCQCM